jgi:hypothetical protein
MPADDDDDGDDDRCVLSIGTVMTGTRRLNYSEKHLPHNQIRPPLIAVAYVALNPRLLGQFPAIDCCASR